MLHLVFGIGRCAVNDGASKKSRVPYRVKFVVVLILCIVIEEVTPFVPFIGLVFIVGLFVPRLNLWVSRHLLAYYDAGKGTAYAGRLPSAGALHAMRAPPHPSST